MVLSLNNNNIWKLFKLEEFSERISIIAENKKISYKDLHKLSKNFESLIRKRCLVFIICKNCVESISGYLGVIQSGAVPVLLNGTINRLQLEKLIEKYRPAYIFLPSIKNKTILNKTIIDTIGSYDFCKTGLDHDYNIHNDLALLLTTSGSTGSPKFVRQSYKNILSNAKSISKYLEIKSTDRAITTLPMSYSYGLSIINTHLLNGAAVILTEASLMDRIFWDEIREQEATTFGGVPYTYEMLDKLRFDRIDLPNINYLTQAGGKLDLTLSKKFADICVNNNIKFYVMYGQTEATSRMSYLPWEMAQSKSGSIGKAIPGGKFTILGDDGIIIEGSDTPGELVYSGDNVTMGYAESRFDLSKGDENGGVLYTGDIAKRDEDGYYYIVGRKKRFLKMFGNRLNLDEVEQIVKELGYECACAGTDDNLMIYITEPEENTSVLEYVSKQTGINRLGFSLIQIDKIPRGNSGKVQYSALKHNMNECNV